MLAVLSWSEGIPGVATELSSAGSNSTLHMQVTDAYKSNLLRKDFFKADNEKWKKRAQNYMAVVEPLEKADYESSSFAAKYGDYHEKGNRPQQFAFIEKL